MVDQDEVNSRQVDDDDDDDGEMMMRHRNGSHSEDIDLSAIQVQPDRLICIYDIICKNLPYGGTNSVLLDQLFSHVFSSAVFQRKKVEVSSSLLCRRPRSRIGEKLYPWL